MAKGKLGKAMASSSVQVSPYFVPSGATAAVVSVDLENTDPTNDATVDIFFSDSASGAAIDRVAHAIVPANGGHFELSCKTMGTGEHVVIGSDNSLVAIRVSGIEEIVSNP